MSSHEGFRGEQGNINTCMLHVLPPGPHFCTVTCILEILSRWWLFCLFFWTFWKLTNCQKDFFFFFFTFFCLFVLYTENVNAVGNITHKDNEHLAVKCIVLNSLDMDGVLFEKMVNDCKYVSVSGLTTPLLLPWSMVSIFSSAHNVATRSI